jgi:pSer/pThr/pTyr-binding forkhead associated (FHA) protein
VAADSGASYALRRCFTRIGRNQDNDIVVNSNRVSRYHAEIVREDDDLKLIDKDSRNGVWLNGKKINESAVIRPGDLIRIGRQDFTFTVKEIKNDSTD